MKNKNFNKKVKMVETGELSERQIKRLESKKKYKQGERAKGAYEVDEGVYDVKIRHIVLKTNVNGNDFIEFICSNLSDKGPKKLYGIYYLTYEADESSLTDLRCLLYEYGYDDLSDVEIIDDDLILDRLQELVGKKSKLVVEDQNGFMSSKLYKEVFSE